MCQVMQKKRRRFLVLCLVRSMKLRIPKRVRDLKKNWTNSRSLAEDIVQSLGMNQLKRTKGIAKMLHFKPCI